MVFEKHLFISYAHIDNQPLTPEQQGWVSRFHASLEAMLSMRMGRRAEIWRDAKLKGNDIFADEIVQQFPKTAVLISVLTPRYVESEWCTREVREFCKVAEKNIGLVVDNKSRIIKVIKLPVDTEEPLPSVMKEALGYPFYIYGEGETPLELDPVYGEELAQKYNLKVAKLAWDVAQLLKRMDLDVARTDRLSAESAAKPTVYLAECSYDRRDGREILEGDLRIHGYPVLPDRRLPMDEADCVAEVESLLARCKLSIHLVGTSYGAVPDGPSQKSLVVLQNEAAVKRSKSGPFQRVIWLPEGTRSDQPQQQAFIEAMLKDSDTQFGADLITGDIEDLKGAVHAGLRKLEKPRNEKPEGVGSADEPGRITYLICLQKDRMNTIPLLKFLKGQGLEVKLPVFEGDAAAIRRANEEQATDCDAVLLFYGAGDEAWKFHQQNELRKIQALRAGKPLLASYTYLAEPATEDKEFMLALEEPSVIDGLKGFSEAGMESFIRVIKQG